MSLDKFYSENPLEVWKIVLGEKMHYHMAVDNEEYDPYDYAVMQLFDYIKPNSEILDCGCGWGGPARLLKEKLNCNITGVTISEQQYNYITDFKVIHSDLHDFVPNEMYNTALFIESYTHLNDPKKVLSNIKNNVNELVIKDFVSDIHRTFPEFKLSVSTYKEHKDNIESAGFEIVQYKTLPFIHQPSIDYLINNLNQLPEHELYGHIGELNKLCSFIKSISQNAHMLINQCIIHAVKN
jgi:hypothetical protein